MPNYAILVDIRDRPSSQITYVPEENIEIITNTKVCAFVQYLQELGNTRILVRGTSAVFGKSLLKQSKSFQYCYYPIKKEGEYSRVLRKL